MISDPSRRITACSSPTALLAASSERNELEHTSWARPSVRCASVILIGRISCSTTGTPDWATCQAASEPARPAPTICTDSVWDLVPVIPTEVARSGRYDNARGSGGRYPFDGRLKSISLDRSRRQRAECPSDQGRYRPV